MFKIQSTPEFPPEEMFSQDESALEESIEESELTEDDSPKKNKKRKAGKPEDKKSKVSSLNETYFIFYTVWTIQSNLY